MSITPVALEGQFLNADGSPASGTVCARLNSQLTKGTEVIAPSTVCGLLDGEGRIVGQDTLALILFATDDPATVPVGASYTLTLSLDGEPPVEFDTPMPSGQLEAPTIGATDETAVCVLDSPVVTLGDLIAATSMVGATVTSEVFLSGSTTIVSVDEAANTVTVAEDALVSVTTSVIISLGCVEFNVLRANAQS